MTRTHPCQFLKRAVASLFPLYVAERPFLWPMFAAYGTERMQQIALTWSEKERRAVMLQKQSSPRSDSGQSAVARVRRGVRQVCAQLRRVCV